MRATLITRAEHAGPQFYEEINISSFEDAARRAAAADVVACGCCEPIVVGEFPCGVLKAGPAGYWIACGHGRWACRECGDPALPYPEGYGGEFGPLVAGSDFRPVGGG